MTFCECRQPKPEPVVEPIVVESADPTEAKPEVDISAIVAQAVAAALQASRSRPASARARPATPHPVLMEPAAPLDPVDPAAPLEPVV